MLLFDGQFHQLHEPLGSNASWRSLASLPDKGTLLLNACNSNLSQDLREQRKHTTQYTYTPIKTGTKSAVMGTRRFFNKKKSYL